jgi:hypothetical protein
MGEEEMSILATVDISKFDIYMGIAITGLFTGLGSALGSYLANKHLIEGTQKFVDKFKRKKK